MYAATHKEMRDNLQQSNKESGQQNALQAEQNEHKSQKMSAAPRTEEVTCHLLKDPWLMAME
jgi:hypothetical protein